MAEEAETDEEGRASDMPVDLAKERETFVRSFLRKGAELTEELLHENEDLRQENGRLQRDNTRLRAQVASDDAIRDLLKSIEALEEEKRQLLERSSVLEAGRTHDEHQAQDIERELNDLANLYIACFQLHNSLSVRRVLRHIMDMLGQLVGAFGFAIYLVEPGGRVARAVAHENLAPELLEPVLVGEGAVGEACLTGMAKVRESLGQTSLENPAAVIPLLVEQRPVGAIAIATMLDHKDEWASVDRELLKLLGAQAGNALLAANLHAESPGSVAALGSLEENLKRRGPLGGAPSGGK